MKQPTSEPKSKKKRVSKKQAPALVSAESSRTNDLSVLPPALAADHDPSRQASQLSDARLSAAHKHALATSISRVQGNSHLQRLLVSKKDGETRPAPAHDPAASTPGGSGGVVEMPPMVITASPLTRKERKFFKDLGFNTVVGGIGLGADNPEFERRESRPNVKLAPYAFSRKPDSLDFDARFEVSPSSAVTGSAPSAAKAWPARGYRGNRYDFFVTTSDIADLNLTVKLVFGPLKLTRDTGVFTIAAPPPIQKTLKVKDKRQEFLDSQTYAVFRDQTSQQWNAGTSPARNVEYVNGRHQLGIWAAGAKPNPGIGVKVGFSVKRGTDVIKVQPPKLWKSGNWLGPGLRVYCGQVSEASDTYTFEVTFSKSDGSPARALVSSPVVIHGWGLGEADVKRIAVRDQGTIDAAVAGLSGASKPEAREAHKAITAKKNKVRVVPMTPCHDTARRVRSDGKDPAEYTAFFCGTDYRKIFIQGRSMGGLTYADDEFGIVVTSNPKTGAQISTDAIQRIIVHEYVHIRDRRARTAQPWYRRFQEWWRKRKGQKVDELWRYKTEFRAYWADGRFDSLPDAFDPFLKGKGPKTPRSRGIFKLLYGSKTLYAYVKKAYEADAAFKTAADTFVSPEGKTIQHPARLILLYMFLNAVTAKKYKPKEWADIISSVRMHKEILQSGDGAYLKKQKEWQDLVSSKFAGKQLASVKKTLGM